MRAFQPADTDEVIRVWLASTIPGQSFLPEEHWRAMEPVVREELLPIADTWIVEEGGEVVAFMSLLDDLIGGLFTDPEHQGRGHGTALVERARALHDPVFVEVFEVNEDAMRFYRDRGFTDHERRIDDESGLVQLILRLGTEMPSPPRPS